MKPSSAIKTDLFAIAYHRKKIDSLRDPLAEIDSCIDYAALADQVDLISPRRCEGESPAVPGVREVRPDVKMPRVI